MRLSSEHAEPIRMPLQARPRAYRTPWNFFVTGRLEGAFPNAEHQRVQEFFEVFPSIQHWILRHTTENVLTALRGVQFPRRKAREIDVIAGACPNEWDGFDPAEHAWLTPWDLEAYTLFLENNLDAPYTMGVLARWAEYLKQVTKGR